MAFTLIWITLVAVVCVATGTELVPERFLRPRDFNHHPFTDVGDNAAAKVAPSLPEAHPYAILASKRPREGRQFPDQDVVLYPNPPAEVLPRKPLPSEEPVHAVQQYHIEQVPYHIQPTPLKPQPLHHQQFHEIQSAHHPHHIQPVHHVQPVEADHSNNLSPYNVIPKNYAFSYSVKDQHSGDDFSHSQAHNGKATRGQYRVKLPDGRVQVVSYTADHKGYRADVQYEGKASKDYSQPQPTPVYEHRTPEPHVYVQEQPKFTPTPVPYVHSPTPAPYEQSAYTPSPTPYLHEQSYSPTPPTYNAPQYVQSLSKPTPGYNQAVYISPSGAPYESQYVPATPTGFQQQYGSPTPASYPEGAYISSTPGSYQGPSYDAAAASPGLQAYASPSPQGYEPPQQFPPSPAPTAYEQPQHYVSASGAEYGGNQSPFAVEPHLRSTPAPFSRHQFESSTKAPSEGQVLVTPRTLFNAALARRGFGSPQHVLYKFSSPA